MEFPISQKSKIITEKKVEFGKDDKKCFWAQKIIINGTPYFGITKCNNVSGIYKPTKKALYLPSSVWTTFLSEIARQLLQLDVTKSTGTSSPYVGYPETSQLMISC